MRWLRLQDNYQSINISSLWITPHNFTGKKLIYKCKTFCGGLGDRFRGIVTCFILALASDRQFMIDMTHPLDVKNYLLPKMYNWITNYKSLNSNDSRKTIHAIDSNPSLQNEIRNTNFIETWSKYDIIDIYTNIDYVSDIFQNSFVQKNKIMKMFLDNLPMEQLTLHNLFPLFFEILFQPSLEIVNALEPILQIIENGYALTCIHLRMGKNPSNPLDEVFQNQASAVNDILDYLNRTKLRRKRNTRIFVASDSQQALSNMFAQFQNQTILVPGPILHVDRPSNTVNVAHGFLKIIVEFYLLGECDTSILTASGFSALANRRRINPYHNVFKYDNLNRRIERCHDIYEYEKPPEPSSVALYCRIVFNCSSRKL
ncbi:unnamed protein product [Rotaria socialis]|nr:unnamed protein product [Rotaria socialis]CAF3632613.1 unnamed protein product [Rotaria socialis]